MVDCTGTNRRRVIDSPVWPPVQFPFGGRFYDGEVKCSLKNNSNAPTLDFTPNLTSSLNLNSCYGFLQVFYEGEHGELDVEYPQDKSYQPFAYFRDYSTARSPDTPYFIFNNGTPEGASFLSTAHTRLVGVLKSQGTKVSDNTLQNYPTQAVVSLWDPSVSWAGGAWHFWKLFVANEAYAEYQHWSEGSLTMAENVVRTHFDASVPNWMSQQTAQSVMYGPSYSEYQGPEE